MSQEDWAELVEEWRASGRTAREFAAAHGVADSALRYWSSRLSQRKPPTSTSRRRPVGRPTAAATSPPLARVVRPGDPAPATKGDARITVVVGKVTVIVEPGFDGAHLRDVVRALSEAG